MLESGQSISLFLAFSAGLFSFLSPCVLPLVPSYISYITGLSFEELTNKNEAGFERREILAATILNSIFFILGFSVVFISLGASASYIGKLMVSYHDIIRVMGGIIIIFFGLFIIVPMQQWSFRNKNHVIIFFGLFIISLFLYLLSKIGVAAEITGLSALILIELLIALLLKRLLQVEKKMHIKSKPAGYVGSFFVGIGFAAGWTPCVGPILGSILLYASTSGSVATGIKLLTIYSIGLALPLFISALAINSFLSYFKKFHKYIRIVTIASGLILVLLGILIYTNSLSFITSYLNKFGIGWDISQ